MKNVNRETSIFDLFIHILQRWRFIIICIIIGILVLGAYGFKNNSNSSSQGSAQSVSENEGIAAGNSLSETRRKVVESTAESIVKYTKLVDQQKDYNEKALYMGLDPYNLETGEIRYYIDNFQETEWNHELNALVQAYTLTLKSEEMYDAMGEMLSNKFGIDAYSYYYYRDLISINTESSDDGIFTVVVYGNNYEDTKELLGVVKTVINSNAEKISNDLGEHNLTIIGENIFTNMNTTVRDVQINYSQTVLDYNTKITNLKATITDSTEKIYLNYLIEHFDDIENDEPETVAHTSGLTIKKAGFSISGKYLGIGAILGLIIAIILIIIKYVATSTIKTHDEMEKYLNIPVLTRMDGDSEFTRKHKTSFDKWLRKKKLRHRHNMSYEENVDLVAAKIEIAAEKNNLKTVCIAMDIDCDDRYTSDIISKLNGKVDITCIKNFLAKAEALQNLSQTDGVVLVEQTEVSRYQDIVEEIRLCEKYDINVIGAIVLE